MDIQFLIYTLFFIVCAGCFSVVFYTSIQNEQWLDRLFNWQKNINKIGSRPGLINEIIYKALGGCLFCFCHFSSVVFFVFYFLSMVISRGWFSTPHLILSIILNIFWYIAFISAGTVLSFKMIAKNEKNI